MVKISSIEAKQIQLLLDDIRHRLKTFAQMSEAEQEVLRQDLETISMQVATLTLPKEEADKAEPPSVPMEKEGYPRKNLHGPRELGYMNEYGHRIITRTIP